MKSEKNHVKIDEIPKENEKKIYVSRSIGDTIYRTVVDTGSIAVVAAFAYALFFWLTINFHSDIHIIMNIKAKHIMIFALWSLHSFQLLLLEFLPP